MRTGGERHVVHSAQRGSIFRSDMEVLAATRIASTFQAPTGKCILFINHDIDAPVVHCAGSAGHSKSRGPSYRDERDLPADSKRGPVCGSDVPC